MQTKSAPVKLRARAVLSPTDESDDYVTVDEKTDEKCVKLRMASVVEPPAKPKLLLSPSLKNALAGRKTAKDPICVKLVASYVTISAAATALTAVQSLSPISVSDWSSFAAVFDLARVKSVNISFRLASSGTINGSADYGLAFDPSNLGAYASVSDVMTARHHRAPLTVGQVANMSPAYYTPTGFYKLGPCKLEPTRVTNDGAAAAAIGGGWFGTSDTTAVVGWLKPFCASLGGALTSTIVYYVEYEVMFKSRT